MFAIFITPHSIDPIWLLFTLFTVSSALIHGPTRKMSVRFVKRNFTSSLLDDECDGTNDVEIPLILGLLLLSRLTAKAN